jgi:phage tail-like protein
MAAKSNTIFMSGEIMFLPTLYQFVRDRRNWDAVLIGVEADSDGNLKLASLPGAPGGNAVVLPPPWTADPSGIATDACGAVFVADTTNNLILFVDGLCVVQAHNPGADSGFPLFQDPTALAVGEDGLWVADSGNARVLHFAFPSLEPDCELTGQFVDPTGLAVQGGGRIIVLDRGLKRVMRFDRSGLADSAFAAALAVSNKLTDPLWLAVDEDCHLYVSDGSGQVVRRFDPNGAWLGDMAPPSGTFQPGAIAAGGGRVFVANGATGQIEIFQEDGTWWCELPGFTGPVTALTLNQTGDLLIKTGLDETYTTYSASKSYGAGGTITCGPYDAGEKLEWFRAAAQGDAPRGTSIALDVVQWDAPTPPPGPGDWIRANSLDTLLATLLPVGPQPSSRRFLWLRATLSTIQPAVTPVLRMLRAETPGEDYRDYLPAMYLRGDECAVAANGKPDEFLFRFLQLLRSEIGAVEEHIDALPQLLSPDFAPDSDLAWLAQWLALALPRIATDAECRELIERAIALYRRRGTPAGIADFVEIYTGVRPSIVEAFELRGMWVLDVASRLGFDTGLPAIDPLGMIVPDPDNPMSGAAGCCDMAIGSAAVGESGPLDVSQIGEPLFADTAYRFAVFLPAYRASDAMLRAEARRILDAEKPAHTDYHLCLVKPDLRIGFQAQVGVDTIVGGPPSPLRLGETRLCIETNLPAVSAGVTRVGQNTRAARTTVLGQGSPL